MTADEQRIALLENALIRIRAAVNDPDLNDHEARDLAITVVRRVFRTPEVQRGWQTTGEARLEADRLRASDRHG